MKAMPVLALALIVPCVTVHAEKLIAEYEGEISSVYEYPDYHVGDRVFGRLVIDLVKAGDPATVAPDYKRWGPDSEFGPEFVSGYVPSDPSGYSTDSVFVSNNWVRAGNDRGLDEYVVSDDAYYGRARELTLAARIGNFLDNTDLRQSFELTSADVDEAGERLGGTIRQHAESYATFLMRRFTVGPARCFAP